MRSGAIIGHEITHGFDDQGRHFDKDGQVREWWNLTTAVHFKNKSRCLVDFYNKFAVEPKTELYANGEYTLGENIADLGGARIAYRAYRNYLAESGMNEHEEKQLRLPGLQHFTNDQIFFIASAGVWCVKQDADIRRQLVLTDDHSLNEFR